MKDITILILIIFIVNSCSINNKKEFDASKDNHLPKIEEIIDTIPEKVLWADDFVIDYIENNSERLTEVDGYPVAYIKDTITKEGKRYARVKIGHNLKTRFVTVQVIFIDRLAKDVFEYDPVTDSLIEWRKHCNNK